MALGEEVMRGGRAIDPYVAAVSRGERTVCLVDAGAKTAGDVSAALGAKGIRVVRMRERHVGGVDRVLVALGA